MKSTTAILVLTLSALCAQGANPVEKLIAALEKAQTSVTTQQGISVSASVTNFTHNKSSFAFRNVIFTRAPAGTYKIEADYRIPFATLTGTSSRIEDTGHGSVKFVVEAPVGKKPFHVTVREYSTGAYAADTNQGAPTVGTESYFGFTFATRTEAENFKRVWKTFLSDLSSVSKDSVSPQQTNVIMGSTQEQVEQLLKDWRVRKSNRSTDSRPIVYYIRDVEVIVSYHEGRAVGVAVIDKPDSGVSPIPPKRFAELLALIGGGEPKTRDVLRDSSGIREFSVGDAD